MSTSAADATSTAAAAPAEATAAPAAPEAAAIGRSLSAVYKSLAGLLGVVTSITALVFTFAPDLAPSGDPPAQSAELSGLSVDEGATFAQYLARIDQPRIGYSDAALRRRGALLDFRVRIEGFKDRRLLLKWELFDQRSGDEVDESKAIQIEPTNETNESTWQFWIHVPRRGGPYVAIVELVERKPSHLLKLATLRTSELHPPTS